MANYDIKDKGIQSNTEKTSAVSTISYEVENALVDGLNTKEISKQIAKLQNKGKFPSNLQLVDAFYDSKTSLSGTAFLDQNTGKVVVGFAGTNLDNGWWESSKDLKADFDIASKGRHPSSNYFKAGNNFMNHVGSKYTISTVTGHSKGGSDGAVLGIAHGVPNIVVYNAAPINNIFGQNLLSLNLFSFLSKQFGNIEMETRIKNYKGNLIYFVSEDDPLSKWAGKLGSRYPGEICIIKNGKPHDMTGFLTAEEQDFIRMNTPDLNKRYVELQQINKETKKQLNDLDVLRKKLLKGGGGLSPSQKIYLDAAEALALTKGMKRTLQVDISAIKKMYKQAIEDTGKLWQNTVKAGDSIGTLLSHSEVLGALMSGGADEGRVKIIPTAEYTAKISELTAIEQEYNELIGKIQSSINKQLDTDRELAQLIRG